MKGKLSFDFSFNIDILRLLGRNIMRIDAAGLNFKIKRLTFEVIIDFTLGLKRASGKLRGNIFKCHIRLRDFKIRLNFFKRQFQL